MQAGRGYGTNNGGGQENKDATKTRKVQKQPPSQESSVKQALKRDTLQMSAGIKKMMTMYQFHQQEDNLYSPLLMQKTTSTKGSIHGSNK